MMFHMTFNSADFQYVLMFNMSLTSIHTVPPSLNTEQQRFSVLGEGCVTKNVLQMTIPLLVPAYSEGAQFGWSTTPVVCSWMSGWSKSSLSPMRWEDSDRSLAGVTVASVRVYKVRICECWSEEIGIWIK